MPHFQPFMNPTDLLQKSFFWFCLLACLTELFQEAKQIFHNITQLALNEN